MTNSIDDLIRLALTDLAEDAPPVTVDHAPLAIRRAVRRRRTATLLVGVASLVAAVLLGTQLAPAGGNQPQPATPPTLPAPAPSRTPAPSDSAGPDTSDSAADSAAPDLSDSGASEPSDSGAPTR
jgi:hypothetical protein